MHTAEEKPPLLVKVGNREIDFTIVPPFTGKDKKELKKLGIEFRDMLNLDPDREGAFVHYLVQKIDPKATQDEVDEMPIKLQQDIILHYVSASKEFSSPFSKPSTSSPASTAGEKKT